MRDTLTTTFSFAILASFLDFVSVVFLVAFHLLVAVIHSTLSL